MTSAEHIPTDRITLMAAVEAVQAEVDYPSGAVEPRSQGLLDPRFLNSKFGYVLCLDDGPQLIYGKEFGLTKEWLALRGQEGPPQRNGQRRISLSQLKRLHGEVSIRQRIVEVQV